MYINTGNSICKGAISILLGTKSPHILVLNVYFCSKYTNGAFPLHDRGLVRLDSVQLTSLSAQFAFPPFQSE